MIIPQEIYLLTLLFIKKSKIHKVGRTSRWLLVSIYQKGMIIHTEIYLLTLFIKKLKMHKNETIFWLKSEARPNLFFSLLQTRLIRSYGNPNPALLDVLLRYSNPFAILTILNMVNHTKLSMHIFLSSFYSTGF